MNSSFHFVNFHKTFFISIEDFDLVQLHQFLHSKLWIYIFYLCVYTVCNQEAIEENILLNFTSISGSLHSSGESLDKAHHGKV